MSLRILQVHTPALDNPFISSFAANVAWLPHALRQRGHDVVVRVTTNPSATVLEARTEGFDVIHVHDRGGAYPALATGRVARVVTGYTQNPSPGGSPWIALSWEQARRSALSPATVITPGLPTESLPICRETGDHLAFVMRDESEHGLAAALAVARAVERPLVVILPSTLTPGPDARRRLDEARRAGVARARSLARNDFPDEVAGAAALLSFEDTPFDMAALTAMACGTPVVALDRTTSWEIVVHGETGFLCRDVEDAARWTERLELLSPAAGRARARVAFDTGVAASLHERLYEDLLSGKSIDFRHPELAASQSWAGPEREERDNVLVA